MLVCVHKQNHLLRTFTNYTNRCIMHIVCISSNVGLHFPNIHSCISSQEEKKTKSDEKEEFKPHGLMRLIGCQIYIKVEFPFQWTIDDCPPYSIWDSETDENCQTRRRRNKKKKKKIRNLFTYSKTIINPQFYPDFIGTHLTFNHQITNHFDEVCITIMITMKMMMMMVVGM